MTKRWRILIPDGLAEAGREKLTTEAEIVAGDSLDPLGNVDALIVRSRTKVTADAMERGLPRLRVIGRAGVGVDNIDLEAARRMKITVVNAPRGSIVAVAEHALALMFAMARHLPAAAESMRRGEWAKKRFKGTQLAGKTLGVIGMGRIGSALAQRAGALGMRVLGSDPLLDPEQIAARGAEPASFDELLAQADFLSLHVPLNETTRGLIGRRAFEHMKPGARMISTARGGVIDEGALLKALQSGHLAGAALDVFEQEPPIDSPLLKHPNVIATPHIGGQTVEAQEQIAIDIAEEVLRALRGEELRWRVA